MIYWRLRTGPPEKGGDLTYIKTDRRYIPDMIVDIAVRQKMMHESFAALVDEVVEVSEEEYYTHMYE